MGRFVCHTVPGRRSAAFLETCSSPICLWVWSVSYTIEGGGSGEAGAGGAHRPQAVAWTGSGGRRGWRMNWPAREEEEEVEDARREEEEEDKGELDDGYLVTS